MTAGESGPPARLTSVTATNLSRYVKRSEDISEIIASEIAN
jgi:hypothetical protein